MQGYGEFSFGYWKSTLQPAQVRKRTGAKQIYQFSLSPVLRLTTQQPLFDNITPFVDAGVGGSYQTAKNLEQEHSSGINMGGHWQFELRLVTGITFGQKETFEISYGWFHYSNAHLNAHNEGLDFRTIQLTYRF